ncbi:hypothetical protein DL765_010651 [Monosporascus sp. GIB2]|nr:hypothetical protein DL765_010651 [Monosporascus sp. GIB2]
MLLGVGYITRFDDQYETQFTKHGIMMLSETDFHDLLAEVIMTVQGRSHQELEIITGTGQNPKASSQTCEVMSPAVEGSEEAVAVLEDKSSRAIQNILQINAAKIDKQSPLVDLGIDPLVAVQVRTWFLEELSVDIPVLGILGGASIPTVNIHWDEIYSLYENAVSAKTNGVNGVNGAAKPGLFIVLPDFAGFVETDILFRLSADLNVGEVHCIAIRPGQQGLADEFLGLSELDYCNLAGSVDAIVHNTAEVNFLESFQALRHANAVSTAKLGNLAAMRSIPMHLVSTAAISYFAENNHQPEISRKIFVHRAVLSLARGAPGTDLMTAVDKYSPNSRFFRSWMTKLVNGLLDIVKIEQVAGGITDTFLGNNLFDTASGDSWYTVLNYYSEEKVGGHQVEAVLWG